MLSSGWFPCPGHGRACSSVSWAVPPEVSWEFLQIFLCLKVAGMPLPSTPEHRNPPGEPPLEANPGSTG